jgi:hypothetical protein
MGWLRSTSASSTACVRRERTPRWIASSTSRRSPSTASCFSTGETGARTTSWSATTKRNALAAEAALLATASRADRVLVESESFGAGNPVYSALDALARRGAAPRLLVGARVLARNHRERATLERLQRDGVDVRVCKDSEKFALAGDRAWVGSANASFDGGRDDMTDWGLATANRSVVSAARARLEARWQNATRQAFVQR